MIYLVNNLRAASLLELVVSCCIIFILVGTFGFYASKVLIAAEEVALRYELANLRLSCELYRILRGGERPRDLKELYSTEDCYILIHRIDKEGYLLDPFGKRYRYNREDGTIKSTSEKYKNW